MALDLAAVLALLASERTPVRLVLSGGDVVTGALEIAGEGIVQCRSAGPGRRSVTVVSAAIESCTPA